jgi:Tfp pilus assembly protein PilF
MKKAIARSPRARLAMRRYVLGHQYLKVGKKKHACEQFKKALAQDPKHVRARRSLKGNCQR